MIAFVVIFLFMRRAAAPRSSPSHSSGRPFRHHRPLPAGTVPQVPQALKPQGEYVWGISPVLAALRARRRTPHMLYLLKDATKRPFDRIHELAKEASVEVQEADREMLNMMTRNGVHQGAVLDASPLSYSDLLELPSPSQNHLWLALDEVTDPQNLGAVIRSASFFGVNGIVVSEKNMAPLNAIVSKASAGAMEQLCIHQAADLGAVLMNAKTKGWKLLGTGLHPKAVTATSYTDTNPSILLLGNEGSGIRPHLLRLSDSILRVPHHSSSASTTSSPVSSLNVSVAAGILLHLLREHMPLTAPSNG